jgi:hypothetical protein
MIIEKEKKKIFVISIGKKLYLKKKHNDKSSTSYPTMNHEMESSST